MRSSSITATRALGIVYITTLHRAFSPLEAPERHLTVTLSGAAPAGRICHLSGVPAGRICHPERSALLPVIPSGPPCYLSSRADRPAICHPERSALLSVILSGAP